MCVTRGEAARFSKKRRSGGLDDTVSDLNGTRIEPTNFYTDNDVVTITPTEQIVSFS